MPRSDSAKTTGSLPWPERYEPEIQANADLLDVPGNFVRCLVKRSLLAILAAEQGISVTQLVTMAVLQVFGQDLRRIARGNVKPIIGPDK